MLIDNIFYISEHSTKYDYFKLKLNLNSKPDVWDEAVTMFIDRINGRYFNPIIKLMKDEDKVKNGFAMMSLMCLLIDVFMQFYNGYPQNSVDNSVKYSVFMRNAFRFDEIIAKRFYSDIRCGLLHSAETKNGSYLVFDKLDSEFFSLNSSAISMRKREGRYVLAVSVMGMYDVLQKYFDEYYTKLIDLNNDKYNKLRENFIAKMDFITMKNDKFNKDSELWKALSRNVGKTLFAYGGRGFKYEKNYEQVAIVVKRFGRSDNNNLDEITIPFSDIKDFAICGNINDANQRRGATKQIKYSAYIQSILECCPEEVKKYTSNRRQTTELVL